MSGFRRSFSIMSAWSRIAGSELTRRPVPSRRVATARVTTTHAPRTACGSGRLQAV